MSVWMIAWANIRKKKSVAISMGILILLSVALFHVGLTLLTGTGSFYEQENKRMEGPDYMVRFSGNTYKEEYLEFFQGDDRVEKAETEEIIPMNQATFPEGGTMSCMFRKLDIDREIKGFQTEELAPVPEEEAVYIPLFFREMGYEPGGTITFQFNKQDYTFRIAGYSTSTWFHSSLSSMTDIFMSEEAYEKLYARIGGGYRLSVCVKDGTDITELKKDFRENTDINMEALLLDAKVMSFSIEEMKSGCTMLVLIISAVLFAFSFIIVVVVIIVIRFRISNHIEAQMQNIGALEAIGYTGKQIQRSIALEFIAIGMVAALLGIVVSYGILRSFEGLITASMGIIWRNEIQIKTDIISGGVVMSVVLLSAQRAAKKAARILPVEALRGGIKPHSFAKNHFALDRTPGSLSTVLGLKNMAFHKKPYIMMGTIFTGVTFACGFAVVLFANMGINDDLLIKMTGFEISDLLVYAAPHMEISQLREELEQTEGIRKTSLFEAASVNLGDEMISSYVSDDFSSLETIEVYEGDFPVYDNETVLTGVLADAQGKNVGDTIELSLNGVTAEYIICGLSQTMSNFGRQCLLSLEGQRRIDPTYEADSIQVYLEPEIDVESFIGVLEQKFKTVSPAVSAAEKEKTAARRKAEEKLANLLTMYGVDSAQYAVMADGEIILSGDTSEYKINRIENNRKMYASNVNSISPAVALISVIILAGTFLIISLVFYMVIKSMIVRRKGEFGIYKAVGYTDWQLMKQIAVSFLPVSVLGTCLGCLISCFSVNRISSILFRQLGISKMFFSVNPWMMVVMGIGIVLYSLAVSMLIARKIKGITVYNLLTEA